MLHIADGDENVLVWEAFEIAVEVAINNGGKAKKGIAQSG